MTTFVFRIYMAANSPNSVRALTNLRAICRNYFNDQPQIEIVDVLEEPHRALADGVLITPSVVRISPSPPRMILGDLSDVKRTLVILKPEQEVTQQ